MTDLNDIHLNQIAGAAARKRELILLRSDGTEIGRRQVPAMARFSMQAASDHKHADKAKAELGDALDSVLVPVGSRFITLKFRNGRSLQHGSLVEYRAPGVENDRR